MGSPRLGVTTHSRVCEWEDEGRNLFWGRKRGRRATRQRRCLRGTTRTAGTVRPLTATMVGKRAAVIKNNNPITSAAQANIVADAVDRCDRWPDSQDLIPTTTLQHATGRCRLSAAGATLPEEFEHRGASACRVDRGGPLSKRNSTGRHQDRIALRQVERRRRASGRLVQAADRQAHLIQINAVSGILRYNPES